MKAYFISDVHLKTLNERNGQILLRFLNSLSTEAPSDLFLVGDIFDFWVGDHDFFYQKFKPIVDQIVSLQKSGTQVHYFEGNHDVHVKKFWESRFHIPCSVPEKYFQLGPLLVRVEHGDMINPHDVKYLKYRDFIRSPYLEKLAHLLPPKAFSDLGNFASRMSRKRSSQVRSKQEEYLRGLIRAYAQQAFARKPFDVLITGHMHILDDWEFAVAGRKVRSINLGSWFEKPRSLLIDDTGISWRELN